MRVDDHVTAHYVFAKRDMPRFSLFLVLLVLLAAALGVGASAQGPAALALHLGPAPNRDGVTAPVSGRVAESYADLRHAHAHARSSTVALVEDPAQADAILTITFRGDVETGTSVEAAVPMASGMTLGTRQHTTRVLRARLSVRATGEVVDFVGVDVGDNDRTRWSTQATRIYRDATAWIARNQERLVRLREK